MKRPFLEGLAIYREILQTLVESPPSEVMVSTPLLLLAKTYWEKGCSDTPDGLWNAYKHLLDVGVHSGGACRAVLTLLDIEARYEPPPGGYSEVKGTLQVAPWRTS
jgi:hypothetical protein